MEYDYLLLKLAIKTFYKTGAPAIFIIIWVICRCFVSVVPTTGPDEVSHVEILIANFWSHKVSYKITIIYLFLVT